MCWILSVTSSGSSLVTIELPVQCLVMCQRNAPQKGRIQKGQCGLATPLQLARALDQGMQMSVVVGISLRTQIQMELIPAVRTLTKVVPGKANILGHSLNPTVAIQASMPNMESTYGFGNNQGQNTGGPLLYSMVDLVQVPKNLKPGQYVLSQRYDCEQTLQVWNSCADITILPADSTESDDALIPDGPAGIDLPPFTLDVVV